MHSVTDRAVEQWTGPQNSDTQKKVLTSRWEHCNPGHGVHKVNNLQVQGVGFRRETFQGNILCPPSRLTFELEVRFLNQSIKLGRCHRG